MNPIINPWWFYLIDVVGEVELIAALVLGIGGIIFAVLGFVYIIDDTAFSEKEKVGVGKLLKGLFVAAVISFVVGSAIPSKKTVYAMMAAERITPNNIEAVGGTIEDAVDYIFEKIDALDNEE